MKLSAEYRLLAGACTPSGGDDGIGHVDWAEVQRLAAWHRLAPLLARHRGTEERAPDPVAAAFKAERMATAARNVGLTSELKKAATALDREGIPAMVLKGGALLELVYPDVSLRPMVDLDLLVRGHDIARAERVILGLGYGSARPHDGGPRQGKYAYPVLVRNDHLVHIDLHRHLLPDAEFPVEDWWDRSVPSAAGSYRLPGREDLLVHAGAHFFKDRLRRSAGSLGQLADIAWAAHSLAPDWDAVVRRSLRDGLGGRVFLAFMATNELLGPVVPPWVLGALRPRSYRAEAGRRFIQRRVLDTRSFTPPGYFSRWSTSRLVPTHEYLAGRYGAATGDTPSASYTRLYLARARAAAAALRSSVPSDVLLTRWMRSLA